MLVINNVELNFDITAPDDLVRYKTEGETLQKAIEALPKVDPTDLDAYIDWLQKYSTALTDWIDNIFGENVCNKLLGAKTSINKILDLTDDITNAVTAQGEEFGVRMKKYTPNRAQRRVKK